MNRGVPSALLHAEPPGARQSGGLQVPAAAAGTAHRNVAPRLYPLKLNYRHATP